MYNNANLSQFKSLMGHDFSRVPKVDLPRSKFNRSFGLNTAFDVDYLVPVLVDEILPGDTVNLNMRFSARLVTPLKPFYTNMYLETFFFFCPRRLLWDNFKKFMGEQVNPGDSTDYIEPKVKFESEISNGSLLDYYGVPTNVINDGNIFINRGPLDFYNLVYNEFFRDQNLQDSLTVNRGDATIINPDYYILRRRGKRHDYFTSCLPFPQKGDAVELPLGTSAPVQRVSNATYWEGKLVGTDTNAGPGTVGLDANSRLNNGTVQFSLDPRGNLYADLSSATAATINQLRLASQLQEYFERDARGGTRYIEKIRSHFGVISSDARLQRPEYLGGGSSHVNLHAVPQMSESATSPQANLAAFGTVTEQGKRHGFVKSFEEHGYLLGLVSVRADLIYQQGLHRMWTRNTAVDHYFPVFSQLGEQAVLRKEIYYLDDEASDDVVFGYQERHAEYRYKPSMITGRLRSNDPLSLDIWHLAQDFGSAPVLNGEFIESDTPIARVIAVPDEPHFTMDAYFEYIHARVMPLYGVPRLGSRF